MNKKLVLLIIPFLLVSLVSALDLSDYPDMFIENDKFNGILVIGDTAPADDVIGISNIAMSLQYRGETTSAGITINKIDVGATRLASEISNPNAQNLILIGMQKRDASYGNPFIDEFYSGSPSGGLIKLIKNGNYYVLIITGDTTDKVKQASTILVNYKDYNLKGMELTIDGVEKTPTDTVSYSIKDTLTEGETKTYTLGAEDYEITVTAITDTGTRYVKFNINGESVKSLKEGDSATISDGNEIKVIEIIPNSAGDITQDLVEFVFNGEEQTQEEEPDEEIDEDITGHLLVVDNKAPSSDVIILTELGVHLKYLGYDMAPSKLNSEVTTNMLHNRVTTFIYLGGAVIIKGKNSPSSYNTLAKVIEDFLEDEKDIKVKTRSSREVKFNDLRYLFPNAIIEEEEEEEEPKAVEIAPPPPKDECTSNQDCEDNNACTTDSCSGIPKKCSNTEISIGCNYNRKCIPIGIRVFDEYCDIDKEVYTQKGKEEPCNNNYECTSNLCVNDQCVSPSLIQKIMNFFRRLVGNAIKIVY